MTLACMDGLGNRVKAVIMGRDVWRTEPEKRTGKCRNQRSLLLRKGISE